MARPGSPPGRVPNLLDAFRQGVLLKRAKMLRIRAPSAAQTGHRGQRRWSCIGSRSWCPCAVRLFDHLISAQPNRWGYGKTERLGGLEVQDHLELCRKLHREIARLLAAQDAIHIGGGATIAVYLVDSRASRLLWQSQVA